MRRFEFLALFASVFVFLAGLPVQAEGVKGKVVFDGKPPQQRNIRMNADPVCMDQHQRGMLFEPIEVGKGGGLANVFVYVKKGLEGKKFDVPKSAKLVLDQKGCWYTPRVSGVMVGEPVEILNPDPTMHNVNAHDEFNKAMPAGVRKIEVSFTKPKVMLKLECNVHPWMVGYIGVVEHPFFAVTDKSGLYEIKGLPPGKYAVEAWHETLGTATREITVGAVETKANFKFQSIP